MPYPASVIAYAFVKKGMQEKLPVTQMKLQKMVFFAHGVYMALNNGDPLIQEEFQAWQFGPVIPNIYYEYKTFGNQPIICDSKYSSDENKNLQDDELAMRAIDYTWQVTKNLSAYTLSNWTHIKGSPWEVTYVPGFSSIPIDNILIAKYFKKMFETAQNAKPIATATS